MAERTLKEYEKKRDFTRTSEPLPRPKEGKGPLSFVVQEHAARRLHYDFRLELDGVLKSWAVPNGPSLDPTVKRLAVMVEDHPLDYSAFEGSIPEGEYGAGQVIIWDRGAYAAGDKIEPDFKDRQTSESLMREGLEKGKLTFFLRGEKLKGSWALVKMQHRKNDWLLIKHRDEFAKQDGDVLKEEESVLSGLSLQDLKKQAAPQKEDPPDLKKIAGARAAPFPAIFAPMLASLVEAPFNDDQWIFEPKLDGFRELVFLHNGSVKLISRNGLDGSAKYPSVVKDLSKPPAKEMVLDGEMVALDEKGRPCFQCLQNWLKLGRSGEEKSTLVYYVFDILYLSGFDLQEVPLLERKKLLSANLKNSDHLKLVDFYEKDGKSLFESAVNLGFEGVMAKRKDSSYEAGRRSKNWLKIKSTLSDDFVIGGFTPGMGNRADSFGSLLLGRFDAKGKLQFAGQVGTGFDDELLGEMRARLDKLKTSTSPFNGPLPLTGAATFVRPELAAEIKFAEKTRDGLLRAPVFLRLREDKSPSEISTQADPPDPPSGASAGGLTTKTKRKNSPVRKDPKRSSAASVKTARKSGEVPLEPVATLDAKADNLEVPVAGYKVSLTHLQKELWPPFAGQPALTKRHFIEYLAAVSPYLLPHLHNRPLTLTRYPDGVKGQRFYQRHIDPLPEYVQTVSLSDHTGETGEYLLCNNAATLLWLGQIADIEIHSWFSRIGKVEGAPVKGEAAGRYPDFIVFDLDPYIYAGSEAKGEEPALNQRAFQETAKVAFWLKEVLEGMGLSAFVKTSGRTGLHIFVPIIPAFEYAEVHAASKTIASYILQQHPQEITLEWSVEKRRGKIFIDYNQNVRSKTLASIYSPRASPLATVSTPLKWDEVAKIYPDQFTILNVPARLSKTGDIWKNILDSKADLSHILKMSGR